MRQEKRILSAKKAAPRAGSGFGTLVYLSSANYLIVRYTYIYYEFSLSYQETTLTSVLPSPMGMHLVCVASKSEP